MNARVDHWDLGEVGLNDGEKPTISSIIDPSQLLQRGREIQDQLLHVAFDGLSELLLEEVASHLTGDKGEVWIHESALSHLFAPIELKFEFSHKEIKALKEIFFRKLKENLVKHFDETPQVETAEYVETVVNQLTGNKEWIRKVLWNVIWELQDKWWQVSATYEDKSGFFESFIISAKENPPEDIKGKKDGGIAWISWFMKNTLTRLGL